MGLSRLRSRYGLAVLPVFMIFLLAGSAEGQGLFGMGFPGLPSLGEGGGEAASYVLGKLLARADVKVGYGHFGLNFNLPILSEFSPPVDLSFRNANTGIGSVGVSVESRSGLFLALRGAANAKRHIIVRTAEGPIELEVTWDGPDMQWWMLDGYAGYRFDSWWALLGGLRRDQITVGLTNPIDAEGNPLNRVETEPGVATVSIHYQGDFTSRLWIPYVGLQLAGQRYRANFLYSPFASAEIKVPIAEFDAFFQPVPLREALAAFVLEFKVKDSTQFVEFNFEYDVPVSRNLSCQAWFTANWMRLRGGGSLNDLTDILFTIPLPPIHFTRIESFDARATYTRLLLAGGIAGVLSF